MVVQVFVLLGILQNYGEADLGSTDQIRSSNDRRATTARRSTAVRFPDENEDWLSDVVEVLGVGLEASTFMVVSG
ncbi:hypothetical protein M6B38_319565 [Iris pallida]|uniref:Uncharacterized protein n=1 Tax=Iris pallida TaxID=29817 RepID=A0AAX6EUD5_IRIPA|nr:hypothetical protein M6B38_171535 [Iris pallida]KAJ6838871.1 hypothetical protein M6B38_319565 [Iris pallida]